MEVSSAAPHHDIFLLVLQVSILLLAARTFGEIATRLGQPSVVGEILAGILLGPTLFSGAIPAVGELIIPQTEVQGYLREVISLLGAMFLLLITGLETDIKLIKHHAKTAISVSFGGITTLAGTHDIDLIIVGTNVRPGSNRLYLGPRVENILQSSPCSVIVMNTR